MIILPCPFCGRIPDINDPTTFENCPATKWAALVCDCGCSGPAVWTKAKPLKYWKEISIKAWNNRAPNKLKISAGEIAAPMQGRIDQEKYLKGLKPNFILDKMTTKKRPGIQPKVIEGLDPACIIKEMARNLLRDYGGKAYYAFVKRNPKAKLPAKEIEKILGKRK